MNAVKKDRKINLNTIEKLNTFFRVCFSGDTLAAINFKVYSVGYAKIK